MNWTPLIAALCLGASATAFAGSEHAHGEHAPLHGGIVVETRQMDYELVARPDRIQVHLRDHGKPVDAGQASGKLTILSGADKQEAELKTAGTHLEAVGSFKLAPGTKIVAQIKLPGKPGDSARFVLK